MKSHLGSFLILQLLIVSSSFANPPPPKELSGCENKINNILNSQGKSNLNSD